eukprot:scaffold615363_cov90-Attheya_sp.AAC.2
MDVFMEEIVRIVVSLEEFLQNWRTCLEWQHHNQQVGEHTQKQKEQGDCLDHEMIKEEDAIRSVSKEHHEPLESHSIIWIYSSSDRLVASPPPAVEHHHILEKGGDQYQHHDGMA